MGRLGIIEKSPGIELYWCQYCTRHGCDPKKPASQGPTPPTTGPAAPLQGGVLEQTPTPPPFDPTAPQQGGVVERPPSEGGVTQRGCQSNVITTCLPCDLGLPGASCIPSSEWPPQKGVLEQQQTPMPPPFAPGFLERQQQPPSDQGAAELPPPATEGAQPATVSYF